MTADEPRHDAGDLATDIDRTRRAVLALGASGAGLAAGCLGGGGDGESSPAATATPPPETGIDPGTATPPSDLEIVASATLGEEPTFDGMEVVQNLGGDADRQLQPVTRAGEPGWVTDKANSIGAFVVDVGQQIETAEDETAVIVVRYFDQGSGGVRFIYGTPSGNQPLEDFDLSIGGTGEWKEYRLPVADAVVSNGELFGAERDFLLRPGNDLVIGRIAIGVRERRRPPEPTEVPIEVDQGSMGSVYVDGETPSFEISTEPDVETLEWTATNYWGGQVASGSESVDGEGAAAFEVDLDRGYHELDLTAIRGGEDVGSVVHTVGKLPEQDFRGIDDSMFGMVSHFNDGSILDLVELSGTKTIRDSNGWAGVEQTKGEYTHEDRHVEIREAADEHDVDTLLTMAYGNDLYYEFTGGDGHTLPPDDESRRAFARYAVHMLDVYGDRAVGSLLWNEPNWSFGNTELDRSPETYDALLEAAYPIISEAHPDVPVLGGAVARARMQYEWSKDVFEQGAAEHLDGWTFHPYRHGQRPESDGPDGLGSTEEEIEYMREMIAEGGAPEDFPLYITEIGHMTGIPGVSDGRVTRLEQSQWIVRTYTMGKATGLERLCYYKFRDGLQGDKGTGILHHKNHPWGTRTPKQAYVTYSVLTRQLTNAEFAGKDELPEDAYSYRFEGGINGGTTRVMWTARGSQDVTIETDAPVTVTTAMGEEQTYAPRDGEVYLTLSEYALYVNGEVSGLSAGAPVSVDAPDVAAGEDIPVTVTSEGPMGTASVDGQTATVGQGETTVDVAGPETPPHTGVRVVSATLADGGDPYARLQSEVAVSQPLSAEVIPRIADADAGTARLDVRVHNHTRSLAIDVTELAWHAGSASGSATADRTIPAGESRTVSASLEDLGERPFYGERRAVRATVSFADREALVVDGEVALNPVWPASPSIDGSIGDLSNRHSIALTEDGTVSMDGYGGADDLGGEAWLAWDDDALYLTSRVTDDQHTQEETGRTTWRGDGIQFAVAPVGATNFSEVNIALTEEGPQVWRQYQPSNENRGFIEAADAEIARDDGAGVTTYEVAIPWDALRVSPDDGAFRTGFAVNDADGGGREGYIWWGGDIGSTKAVDALTTAQLLE